MKRIIAVLLILSIFFVITAFAEAEEAPAEQREQPVPELYDGAVVMLAVLVSTALASLFSFLTLKRTRKKIR